ANGLEAKQAVLDAHKFQRLDGVFPMLAVLKNGNYVVIAGIHERLAEDETKQTVVLVFDPVAQVKRVLPTLLEDFIENWTGTVVFVKRRYAFTDENQPFGLTWFIPQILKQKKVFRDVSIAILMLHILGLFTPIFFQLVIDKVLVHQSFSTLYVLTIGICAALSFEAAFSFLRQYLLLEATNKIDISLVTKTFSHLLALPINFFERSAAGVTVRHMQQVEKIRQFLTGQLFLTGMDATVLFIYLPFLYFYSPLLTWVVLSFTAIIGLVIVLLIKPFRRRLQQLYNAEAERQAMLVESISGMRTVKSLALEPTQRRQWDRKAAFAVNSNFNVGKISITANNITTLLQKLMMVAIIALGAGQVFAGVITVGALIAFNMLSARVVNPLIRIVSLIHEYQETALSVKMLGSVMNRPPERKPGQGGLRPSFRGAIQFEQISFKYNDDGSKVLDNINLNIPASSIVGIVGRSGSGKSTLTKLIQSLYPLQEGVIRIDGTDIREIDLDHLRRNTGVVLQESFLFRGTVRENIGITRSDASLQEIDAAAQISGAKEFIEKLPQGYDTLLEENADNLSGGQKQRLAIARAVLPRPRILIMDEATSALDPDSEAIFMDNLAILAKDRTVLIVSHRLSMLLSCNVILVMDNGRIIDAGSHSDLLNRCKIYQHLWKQQNRHQNEQ
ncbi:MAG: peptidase domain-containing ABC transporter, partial [Gammaproteobacteria bacterium]|nr:peptidase domain-containing ABC transporter [Gammaproteobacteria bacterium]